MKRRNFIKKTGVFLLAPTLINACEKQPIGKAVLVVGGGISGLATAKTLKDKGFKVTVLESREKIGGRSSSNRTLGIAFDEGASWIHGATGNPITDLAQKAGMATFETVEENRKSYDIGRVVRSSTVYDAAETELESIMKTLMKKGNATQSFEAIFNAQYPNYANNRLWKFLLSNHLTFETGDLDKLSSLLYDEGEVFGGAERIATNGYDTIPNFLAQGLDIQLNQRVTHIDYSETKVKVIHNSKTTEADYVVVTVPLGVLKKSSIAFVPALPTTKQVAIQKLGMNCVNKFLLTWDTAFWDDVHYISYTPEARDKFNYFLNVKKFHPSVNALMTFAYADYARQTETLTDAQITTEIMSHLRDMYGSGIPNPKNMLRTKWQTNENAFGSYSYTTVGSEMRHFDDLAAEVNNKLFFAGEHTHIDYYSTAHGAYLSGLREAQKIIDLQ
jgi:monoamine oxidase